MKCPECGTKLQHKEGCTTCPNCGYSLCNMMDTKTIERILTIMICVALLYTIIRNGVLI